LVEELVLSRVEKLVGLMAERWAEMMGYVKVGPKVSTRVVAMAEMSAEKKVALMA
jgi:hypothetical protein